MKPKYNIIISILILILFVAYFYIDSNILMSSVLILILISIVSEFINRYRIKNRIEQNEIKYIETENNKMINNLFWWPLFFLWIGFLILNVIKFDKYNIIISAINIWICLFWIFFRMLRYSFYYDDEKLWYRRFKTTTIPFENILNYEMNSKRITLKFKDGKEKKLPRHKAEINHEIQNIIKKFTLPNNGHNSKFISVLTKVSENK